MYAYTARFSILCPPLSTNFQSRLLGPLMPSALTNAMNFCYNSKNYKLGNFNP